MLIIFDLDDTLVDSTGCTIVPKLREALQAMVDKGLPIDDFEKDFSKIVEMNKTIVGGRELLHQFVKDKGADEKFFDVGYKKYVGEVTHLRVKTLPGAIELLQKLKDNHTLTIVSMGDSSGQLGKIKKAGIDPNWFSELIFTKEYDKTEQYLYLQKKFASSVDECVVIGDKVDTDLFPAKKLGMKTIWMKWGRGLRYQPKEDEVDFEVSDMAGLTKIIERLS